MTVHQSNADMNERVIEVARRLNLKPHYVGDAHRHFMYGPVDLEGHNGRDGRLYLCDLARLFPPEAPGPSPYV